MPADESDGALCWPHARAALVERPPARRRESSSLLADRFLALAAELRELIRKSDWSNRNEERGAEQDSWLRALHALAGPPRETISQASLSDEVSARAVALSGPIQRAWRKLRPARPVRLDLAGIKLEEALERGGCPVCSLASDSVRRWLFILLWEGIMDPEVRGRIRAADGFCSDHWWRLTEVERKEMHSVSGVAILAEDTLTCLAEQLRSDRTPAGPSARSCLACAARRRGEDGALTSAARHLARPEFRDSYLASEGSCAPHRRAIAARLDDPALSAIVIAHGS